ncbi:MAG: Gfo/Idh/MocA family oxidoreductase [Candidatus Omnitrophica bacterium]|nr:Gfo/Idh/MocA family oxidoreductase [Candidatus Omnitrophota bacterium]
MAGKVRIGFVGAGGLANAMHYPSLSKMEDVELAGICDMDEKKLTDTAEKYHIKNRFTNYKEMIKKVDLDAVYIIMPPHHIFDLVIECLKNKLNIFIEKPPGVMKEQTRQMALLAEKNKCLTMVSFQRRFSPVTVKARSIIEKNGPITQCLVTFVKNYTGGPYYDGASDVLTSDVIHAVDNLRWLGGEVKKISASVRNLYADYDNSFNAIMEFENGAIGFLVSNFMVGKRIFAQEMHAKGISAYVEPEVKAVIYTDNIEEGTILESGEIAGSNELYVRGGFYSENRHFIDCVKNKKIPMTNFSDACKTMELVDRIYHSGI